MFNDYHPMLVALRSVGMQADGTIEVRRAFLHRTLRMLLETWDTELVKQLNLAARISGMPEADPLNGERVWYRIGDGGYYTDSRWNIREVLWREENTAN